MDSIWQEHRISSQAAAAAFPCMAPPSACTHQTSAVSQRRISSYKEKLGPNLTIVCVACVPISKPATAAHVESSDADSSKRAFCSHSMNIYQNRIRLTFELGSEFTTRDNTFVCMCWVHPAVAHICIVGRHVPKESFTFDKCFIWKEIKEFLRMAE